MSAAYETEIGLCAMVKVANGDFHRAESPRTDNIDHWSVWITPRDEEGSIVSDPEGFDWWDLEFATEEEAANYAYSLQLITGWWIED